MPELQFREPTDTKITVKDPQGNVLFTADVLEINTLLASSQRSGGNYWPHFAASLKAAFNLPEAPTPYNCNLLASAVVNQIKQLKNVDGSTPSS
jgi:hypothetical protein